MTRFKTYPKQSIVLYLCKVKDSIHVENRIMAMFKEHFSRSIREMINLVEQHIAFMDQRVIDDYIPIINSYKNRVTFKISNDIDLNDIPKKKIKKVIEGVFIKTKNPE